MCPSQGNRSAIEMLIASVSLLSKLSLVVYAEEEGTFLWGEITRLESCSR